MQKYTTVIEYVKESRRYRAHIKRGETNETVYTTNECSNADTALRLAQQQLLNLSTENNTEKVKKPFTIPQKDNNPLKNTTRTCCRR